MDGVSFVGPLSVQRELLGPYPWLLPCVHKADHGRTGVTDDERSSPDQSPLTWLRR
jgi:hypothetical protein